MGGLLKLLLKHYSKGGNYRRSLFRLRHPLYHQQRYVTAPGGDFSGRYQKYPSDAF